MKTINKPKVTLIGAGPGDVDLITVKGVKALQNAKVVLYDALVNRALLSYVAESSLKIFVGKRKGCHTYSQDKINELIIQNALLHKNVVRLKGDKTNRKIEYVIKPTYAKIDVNSRTDVNVWIDGENHFIKNVSTVEISKGSTVEVIFNDYSAFKKKRRL